MEIKDLIRSLVQQCNIESISTKELAKELTSLYDRVEKLLYENDKLTKTCEKIREDLDKEKSALAAYKAEYVTPEIEMQAKKKKLTEDIFKFETEKIFVERENQIYRELVRSLTSSVLRSENYYNGPNSSYSNTQSIDKPHFPEKPFR